MVPAKDTGELAKAIKLIIENKNLNQKFSQNARDRFQQNFKLEQMTQKTLDLYYNLYEMKN